MFTAVVTSLLPRPAPPRPLDVCAAFATCVSHLPARSLLPPPRLTDVFATFKDLLTRHKPLVAHFLADNYTEVGSCVRSCVGRSAAGSCCRPSSVALS